MQGWGRSDRHTSRTSHLLARLHRHPDYGKPFNAVGASVSIEVQSMNFWYLSVATAHMLAPYIGTLPSYRLVFTTRRPLMEQ